MNTSILVSVIIGIGWLLATVMGIAILAMAQFVGSRYAYTQLGVSRMGPRLGKQLGSSTFVYQNTKVTLRQLASQEHWTFFVFLDTSPVSLDLIPDLLKFASYTTDDFDFVVICQGAMSGLQRLAKRAHFPLFTLAETDDDLPMRLGIRVQPYALLVNQDTELVAKGLVNHTGHLCLLVHNAQVRLGEKEELARVSDTICQPYLEEIRYTENHYLQMR